MQDQAAQALKGFRHQHGALSLETIEARAVFDGDTLTDLRAEEKNRAKELIEDFMIAANGVDREIPRAEGFPVTAPGPAFPERWRSHRRAGGKRRHTTTVERQRPALESSSPAPSADPARFPDVSLSVIKLLGRGEYEIESARSPGSGHFGLAVKDYTHSTAPNRRFPDLITQRLLKAALAGGPVPYGNDELGELARHCTEQGQRHEGRAAGAQVGRGAPLCNRASATASTPS